MRNRISGVALALVLIVGLSVSVGARTREDATGIHRALQVQERHSERLLERGRIVGTAVGTTASGDATIIVLTTRPGVKVRDFLGGVPVTVEVTGVLRAAHHRPGHGGGPGGGGGGGEDPPPSPTDRHDRPVPIGISTGNELECSAGTIGARVKDGAGNVYSLSNNHVYALENAAPIGSRVLQPGLYDTGCSFSAGNVIGTLSDFEPMTFDGSPNTVDAAIATTTTGDLSRSTPSDGYGTPASATVSPAAALGASVWKYGRTTGQTNGTVTGINADIQVRYDSGVALFEDQLIVESGKGPLLKAGDSGSLVVTRSQRGPVGLLFAGNSSGKLGVANPIGAVLSAFNVTIDGT